MTHEMYKALLYILFVLYERPQAKFTTYEEEEDEEKSFFHGSIKGKKYFHHKIKNAAVPPPRCL